MGIYITSYRGFTIEYWEHDSEFMADDLKADTLEALKKKIDQVTRKDFKRIKVIIRRYDNNFLFGEITSILDGGESVWISYDKNHYTSRGKESISSIYLDTPENRKSLERQKDIEGNIKLKKEEIKKEIAGMEKYSNKDN